MTGGGDGPASVVAIDLSCSGLAVASPQASAELSPAVAPASVLAAGDGSALPPGGDRMVCSEAVDALAAAAPGQVLADPAAHAHRDRVEVAGLSVPVAELLAAPLARALRMASARVGDDVVLLTPSAWGRPRVARVEQAATALGVRVRTLRAALVTAEALPSSSARWTMCVEAGGTLTTVTLVERSAGELRMVDRAAVPREDPTLEWTPGGVAERVVSVVAALRRATREAGTGSLEVLVRGVGAHDVVDACDRARITSFLVAPTAVAEAAVRLGPRVPEREPEPIGTSPRTEGNRSGIRGRRTR